MSANNQDPTTQKGAKRRWSLLDQHLRIMGMTDAGQDQATRPPSAVEQEALHLERERIESFVLPDLVLPKKPKSSEPGVAKSRVQIYGLLALAASLAAVVLIGRMLHVTDPASDASGISGIRAKGENGVWVYWERDGQAAPWHEGVSLLNGDRIRTEVLAAADDIIAYQAVISENNTLLSDPAQVLGTPLPLRAGQKASFEGSVKLVGANEGETLMVLTCKDHVAPDLHQDLSALFKARGDVLDLRHVPAICELRRFKLR
jgi:hypothetical protein